MAMIKMREVEPGEVPYGAGTAVQEDADRPSFTGNGPDDYVCVKCGNVLAHAMHSFQMNVKLRVKCAVCKTVNVAVQVDPADDEPKAPMPTGWPGGRG